MTTLYVAVSNGYAWGIEGGGEETGPARAIRDAKLQLVFATYPWWPRDREGLAEAEEMATAWCEFRAVPATREQALRVVREGPLHWPHELGHTYTMEEPCLSDTPREE